MMMNNNNSTNIGNNNNTMMADLGYWMVEIIKENALMNGANKP